MIVDLKPIMNSSSAAINTRQVGVSRDTSSVEPTIEQYDKQTQNPIQIQHKLVKI